MVLPEAVEIVRLRTMYNDKLLQLTEKMKLALLGKPVKLESFRWYLEWTVVDTELVDMLYHQLHHLCCDSGVDHQIQG